jgi:hypothetical protein
VTKDLLSLALGDTDESSSPTHPSPSAINKTRPQPPPHNSKSSLPDKFRSKIRSISNNDTPVKDQSNNGSLSTEQDSPINKNVAQSALENSPKGSQDMATFRHLQQMSLGRGHHPDAMSEKLEQVIKESSLSWNNYLKKNDSIITDIFGGQLQSTIECLTCHHRSHCFDPFLDLSVPIEVHPSSTSAAVPDKHTALRNKLGGRKHVREPSSCSLEDCFASYSATEMLEGDNAYNCEKCKSKQKSSKRLAIFKYPQILVSLRSCL